MNRLKHILIVEDDENDAFLIQRAFRSIGYAGEFSHCVNGAEAITYLENAGKSPGVPWAQVVVTDLKMPRLGGFELLEWIKGHPDCMVVPTIVLSSSKAEQDVRRAYCLGANAYLTKPATINELQEQLQSLVRFWNHCEKPERGIHSPCDLPAKHAA